MKFILLINVKMLSIVDILTLISKINTTYVYYISVLSRKLLFCVLGVGGWAGRGGILVL